MVRAFVAIELSGEIRERLAEAQDVLRCGTSRLTYVDPALIHITVKFLGEVEERKIPQVKSALCSIPCARFSVTVGHVTVNSPRNPRTVWSVIEDCGKGAELFRLVETDLEPLGFRKETRPFTPHATVARVRSANPSLFTQLDLLRGKTYGCSEVPGLKLKKSTLTPRGPVYEDLLEITW